MKKIFLFILIIYPIWLFGQKDVTIILADGTEHEGDILEYNDTTIKLLKIRREVMMIQQTDIVFPEQPIFDTEKFITTIETKDGNTYRGKVFRENEASVTLIIGQRMNHTIDKSTIVTRQNRLKKRKDKIRTILITKDGNTIKGDILQKDEDFTTVDLGKGNIIKIKNQNIKEIVEKYNGTSPFEKALAIIGGVYLLGILISEY